MSVQVKLTEGVRRDPKEHCDAKGLVKAGDTNTLILGEFTKNRSPLQPASGKAK